MTLDWYFGATSLKNLVKNYFRELGLLMNQQKNFTIAGIRTDTIGIGDINQHYDCVHIPNMGGYRFPKISALTCNNLIVSPSGIDEVILGKEVYKTEVDWKKSKPVIEEEVEKWKKYSPRFKAVHVVTNSEKENMIDYLGVPEDKIHVIPHGVNHDIFKPPADKEECRKKILAEFFIENSPYFIHVSELNWARKNMLRLLEAFKDAKDAGLEHKLIIVGKNDPLVYEIASKIQDVQVLGFVSEKQIVDLLGAADAIILPSKHEGFGLPLLEAMACGTPSITSNTFSPPEVVGDSGLLVDPYDIQDITKKILEMAKHESLRNDLSKKAFERSQKFSWTNSAVQLHNLYEKTIPTGNDSFEENLDLAAYRTLVTICEIHEDLRGKAIPNLLEFNYTRIINWSLEKGLSDPDVSDFLIPFENWLRTKKECVLN